MSITITAGQPLFQREIYDGVTSQGPVTIEGTYTGSPPSITVRVFKVADDVEVGVAGVDAAPSGGTYSITVADVPESVLANASGDLYYATATAAAGPGNTASSKGAYEFHVGRWIVVSGQSNANFMFSKSSSPPAAATGTYYRAGAFAAVPSANGVRELLNGLVGYFGVPWGCVQYAVSGTVISSWIPGQSLYNTLLARVQAVGDYECMLWTHGESAATEGTGSRNGLPASYAIALNSIHGALATDAGRTSAQFPMIVNGLSRQTDTGVYSNSGWHRAQMCPWYSARKYDDIYYSHAMIDATMDDSFHWDAASQGRHGQRSALAIAKLFGEESTDAFWEMTACARVSNTVTRVTMSTPPGGDFAPSTGITGFEVSSDGVTWVAATGAKVNATTIDLTHASLPYTNRAVRFCYGPQPDLSNLPLADTFDTPPMTSMFWTTGGDGDNPIFQMVQPSRLYRSATTVTHTDTVNTGAICTATSGTLILGYAADQLTLNSLTINGETVTAIASDVESDSSYRVYSRVIDDDETFMVATFAGSGVFAGSMCPIILLRGTLPSILETLSNRTSSGAEQTQAFSAEVGGVVLVMYTRLGGSAPTTISADNVLGWDQARSNTSSADWGDAMLTASTNAPELTVSNTVSMVWVQFGAISLEAPAALGEWVAIAGATSSTLVTTDNGPFRCVVSGHGSDVISNEVTRSES